MNQNWNRNQSFYNTKFVVTNKSDSYFYVKNKTKYYILYKKTHDFNLGDELLLDAIVTNLDNSKKSMYFKSEGIQGILVPKDISVTNNYFNFKRVLIEYSQTKGSYFQKYFLLLTFGINSSTAADVYDVSKSLGVLHLIVISGFHFNLIFQIFNKLFEKLRFKNSEIFALLLVTIYYIIIEKNSSTFRAYFSILIALLVKLKFNTNIKSVVTFIVGIFSILINPFLIIRQGFWYSYTITIFINDFNKLFSKLKSKTLSFFLLSFSIYLVSIILSLMFGNSINALGFINILILTPVCEFLIIKNLFFWWFSSYVDFMYKLFDFLLNSFNYLSVNIDFNLQLSFVFWAVFIYIIYLLINFVYFRNTGKKNL